MTAIADPVRTAYPRIMTPDDATKLVGQRAAALEPNVPLGTIVTDSETGEPVLAYLPLADPAPLRRALRGITHWNGVQRQSVYRSKSQTFGYAPPRVAVLRESCSLTQLGRDFPDVERLLESYADQFGDMLDMIDPAIPERDAAAIAEVKTDWRIGRRGLWTSGVINDTAALPYHRDGFNFPTWSAMPVLRRGVRGGALHVPEYGVTVGCADATVTLFPGRLLVHGVTPLRRAVPDGYRFSVVYYALRGMRTCREAAEEARQGRINRTQREAAMAARLAVGDRSIPSGGRKGRTTDEAGRRMYGDWRGMGKNPDKAEGPRQ